MNSFAWIRSLPALTEEFFFIQSCVSFYSCTVWLMRQLTWHNWAQCISGWRPTEHQTMFLSRQQVKQIDCAMRSRTSFVVFACPLFLSRCSRVRNCIRNSVAFLINDKHTTRQIFSEKLRETSECGTFQGKTEMKSSLLRRHNITKQHINKQILPHNVTPLPEPKTTYRILKENGLTFRFNFQYKQIKSIRCLV